MAKKKYKVIKRRRVAGGRPRSPVLLLTAGSGSTALVKTGKGRSMARKRRSRARTRRRRTHYIQPARRRRHHRRSSGGGVGSFLPTGDELKLMAGAGLYGYLEGKAKADADFFLNKVPKPIAALGFAGNTALALYIAGHLTRNRWVKLAARSTAMVAAYQIGRKGEAFKSGTDVFSISGYDDDDVARQLEDGGPFVSGLDPNADPSWNDWG